MNDQLLLLNTISTYMATSLKKHLGMLKTIFVYHLPRNVDEQEAVPTFRHMVDISSKPEEYYPAYTLSEMFAMIPFNGEGIVRFSDDSAKINKEWRSLYINRHYSDYSENFGLTIKFGLEAQGFGNPEDLLASRILDGIEKGTYEIQQMENWFNLHAHGIEF